MALPEDFTCPVSLDETGQFDWTSRSLHVSCHTGQARSTGLCVQIARSLHLCNRFRLARSTGLFETLSLESLTRFGTLAPPTPFFGSLGSDIHRLCHRPTHLTHNLKETNHRKTLTNPSDYPKRSGVAVRWRLCWCAWSLWRHSRAMRTFLIADPSPHLPLREVFLLIGSLTIPVFGLEPSLSWLKNDKPSARP